MSDNVFDILLRARDRRKKNRSRLNSLISSSIDEPNKTPSSNKENSRSIFDEIDGDLGEERDQANYLEGLEKLSMRELDEMSEREQLRILKLAYNKTYHKTESLSELLNSRDREIRDLKLDNEKLKGRIMGFRNAYRDLVGQFPGNAELKNIINSGNWVREDVTELIEEAVTDLVNRYDNANQIIEDNSNEYLKIINEKDEKIAKLQEIVKEMLKIEDQIKSMISGKMKMTKQSDSGVRKKVEDLEYEESPEGRLNLDLKDKKEDLDALEEYDLDDELEQELEDQLNEELDFSREEEEKQNKKESNKSYKPHFSKELSPKRKKENRKPSVKKPDKVKKYEDRENPQHPLSPNYKEVEKQEVSDIFDANLDSYLNRLSNEQEFILKIIGETGISRNTDLRDYLTEHKEGFEMFKKGSRINYQQLTAETAALRGLDILSDQRLTIGGMGGSQVVFELSNIGKQCYKSLFDDNPVVPEKKRIVDMHGSLEHGYMIKDSANIFREMGYEVLTETEDLTFKLENGRRKIFDLVIIDKENDNKKMLVEVERGTHTKEDFYDAMDRIYEITDEFYFITPNDNILNTKTRKLFFEWIRDNLGGVTNAELILYTTTIPVLNRRPKNVWTSYDLRNFSKNKKKK